MFFCKNIKQHISTVKQNYAPRESRGATQSKIKTGFSLLSCQRKHHTISARTGRINVLQQTCAV